MINAKNIVEAEHICKSYVGVQALNDVSITIKEGEIKCLAGENGCGKSTLFSLMTKNIVVTSIYRQMVEQCMKTQEV